MNPENEPSQIPSEKQRAEDTIRRLAGAGLLTRSDDPWSADFIALADALQTATGEQVMRRQGEADPKAYRDELVERAERFVGEA